MKMTRMGMLWVCAAAGVAASWQLVHAQEGAADVGAGQATVQVPTPASDYSQEASWVCRPGRKDACAIDQDRTSIAADGSLSVERWKINPEAPIDCFYVYPTVSLDPGGNSDMNIGPEERGVVAAQLARFGSQCRTFAPLYRQVTLSALRGFTSGNPIPVDRDLGYRDVLAAWRYYLENDNQGRGFVLVGHSQGSGVLRQLIAQEIDGKPIQSQLISAMLIGNNIPVPQGKDRGGAFENVPVCRANDQIGCLISYVSFRENAPPPTNSRFGRVPEPGQVAVCTNPASLSGGRGTLKAHLRRATQPGIDAAARTDPTLAKVETPFYGVPGLLSAECVQNDKGSYLAVRVEADPKDARMDDIPGDVVVNGQVVPEWGLHLVDVSIAMGNLESIMAEQSKAYLAAQN